MTRFATRLTQNNRNGVYRNQVELSDGEVHISMLGDPTLRPFPLSPGGNLRVSVNFLIEFPIIQIPINVPARWDCTRAGLLRGTGSVAARRPSAIRPVVRG